MFRKRRKNSNEASPPSRSGVERVDIPVYLDAGIALAMSSTLGRGVITESAIETARADQASNRVRAGIGFAQVSSVSGQIDEQQSVAVTESEVRKQTLESIFNSVRSSLDDAGLLKVPESSWADFDWTVGDFVDFRTQRVVVPLMSMLARVRALAEAVAFATAELSPESLQRRVPQLLEHMRAGAEDDGIDADTTLDTVLGLVKEVGEVARALAGVVQRVESESEATGLVDIIMFEQERDAPVRLVVASLDRGYVDDKLLWRMGQSEFGVLGKVVRAPADGTAFNAFRNSMFGAASQFAVLLSQLTDRLREFPALFGDAVGFSDGETNTSYDFVGSSSAVLELSPLLLVPTVEVLPVAIYA